MAPMRLLIDARMLEHSGIGTYLTNVLPGVLRRCTALHPVVLTLPELIARAGALAGAMADVRSWNCAPLTLREVVPPMATSGTDLWWSPHVNVPLASSVPLAVTIHDLLPLSDAGAPDARHKRLAYRLWLRAIRTRARAVMCVSEFTRGEVERLGRLPPALIRVVPPGVDARWTQQRPARDPRVAPYLVFVGLVKPHKNLMGLLRAFETLLPLIPHRLVIVGRHRGIRDVDGDALAFARRLGPRVEVQEDVPQDRLMRLVAEADLLVQPSLYEGFGLPPLEAMAAGTPVLVSRIAALAEVCADAAAYCDPRSPRDIAESIRRIIEEPGLRERLRDAGRARARAFTWDACAQATGDTLLAAVQAR